MEEEIEEEMVKGGGGERERGGGKEEGEEDSKGGGRYPEEGGGSGHPIPHCTITLLPFYPPPPPPPLYPHYTLTVPLTVPQSRKHPIHLNDKREVRISNRCNICFDIRYKYIHICPVCQRPNNKRLSSHLVMMYVLIR